MGSDGLGEVAGRQKKQLRILHIGPLPPPWSGIGVFMESLLASKPMRAQSNYVVNTSRGGLPGDSRRGKFPTPWRICRHLNLSVKIMKTIFRNRIEVVHLNGSSHDLSFFGNWLTVVGAKLTGVKVVWHLHENLGVALFPGESYFTRRVFGYLTRAGDALAVLTPDDKRVAMLSGNSSQIAVLPSTASTEFMTLPLIRRNKDIYVIFVGWLSEAKGIYDCLKVALKVRERKLKIQFWILGTGMSREETQSVRFFVDKYNLGSHVRLCGVITGEAKKRMFAEADVLFHPTHWDAFPLAVLEAMASGLPILSTKVGGIPTMVEDKRGGILVEVGNVSEMTDSLIGLARNPSLRVSMGRANRERFLNCYHPDVVGQQAIDLYLRLLSGTAKN
jgi:glycosyltransferase involved in cell wall biosynthesis